MWGNAVAVRFSLHPAPVAQFGRSEQRRAGIGVGLEDDSRNFESESVGFRRQDSAIGRTRDLHIQRKRAALPRDLLVSALQLCPLGPEDTILPQN